MGRHKNMILYRVTRQKLAKAEKHKFGNFVFLHKHNILHQKSQ